MRRTDHVLPTQTLCTAQCAPSQQAAGAGAPEACARCSSDNTCWMSCTLRFTLHACAPACLSVTVEDEYSQLSAEDATVREPCSTPRSRALHRGRATCGPQNATEHCRDHVHARMAAQWVLRWHGRPMASPGWQHWASLMVRLGGSPQAVWDCRWQCSAGGSGR